MEARHDYSGKCWWCGQPAGSREHKYKRTDVVRAFGPPPWNEAVVHVKDGKQRPVQGPNSDLLKFGRSLCQRCNNSTGQPFDDAYDEMMDYLSSSVETIKSGRSVDQRSIFGAKWKGFRTNTIRYIVKAIGCRLAEDGVEVPQAFIQFLNGSNQPPDHLNLQLCFNLDILELERHLSGSHSISAKGSLWLGDSLTNYEPSNGRINGVRSHIGVERFWFVYDTANKKRRFQSNLASRRLTVPHIRNLPEGSVDQMCQECSAQD